MPTTAQMLLEYPDTLLQVLAELRGAFLDAADHREQAVDILSDQITDPTSVQMAYEDVGDYWPESQTALDLLLKEGGEMAEAQFSRQFGSVRQMGPAKLQREQPWMNPESPAELLYYYGLIGRTFKGVGQAAHTIIFIPTDVAPWLPHPQSEASEGGLPVRPAPPPPRGRVLVADDSFLEDAGSLLGFLHTDGLRLTPKGPHPEDTDHFVQRLQTPYSGDIPDLHVRLALLLHLANRLGWLRRGDDGHVHLTGNRVRQFLDLTRAEQRGALWDAWCETPEWNDLCQTPGLECAETGNWHNDPLQTRQTLLRLLATLQPGAWYNQDEVIQAIKDVEPDFQRPTGDYETWYIRSTETEEFLKGFDRWDAVEGALVRFLIRGPLHWLGALDLAEPSAGDNFQLSLSQAGAQWLDLEVPQPYDAPRKAMIVGDDFTVRVPYGVPLTDRFRVERFAAWQESYPDYVYQISQRSLKRAADEGIATDKIVDFLRSHTKSIPPKVITALERFSPEKIQ